VLDAFTRQGVESGLSVYHTLAHEIGGIEQTVSDAIKLSDDYRLLQTIRGVGPILAQTIQLEVGDINRFASAGKFASYCRCVQSERMSNGKRKGKGNAKAGNAYLSWAYSEAAHFVIQWEPLAKRFFERKKRKTNGMIAMRAVARKLARASWMMLKHQRPFEPKMLFG